MSNELILDKVAEYQELGFRVFPTDQYKQPVIREWQEEQTYQLFDTADWWRNGTSYNIAVATGRLSGLIVLDVDTKNDQPGIESLRALEERFGQFVTRKTRTPSGGFHIFFRYPDYDGRIRNKRILEGYPGIEVKADGGCVLLPPSQTISGQYEDVSNSTEIASVPVELLAILTRRDPCKIDHDEIPEVGSRNDTFFKQASSLRTRGWGYTRILNEISERNYNLSEPLPESEIESLVRSACSYPDHSDHFERTDSGNAIQLVRAQGEDLKYCAVWKQWLIWDEKRWRIDDKLQIFVRAKQVLRRLYMENCNSNIDGEEMKDRAKWLKGSRNLHRVQAMIKLAGPEVAVTPDELDRHPYLLNLENGVYDLEQDCFLSHQQSKGRLITKLSPVIYDPEAQCPRWEQFMLEIMDGDVEMASFLQRAVGLSLSGNTSEQCLFILYGTGENGKSTFVGRISKLLGEYSIHVQPETLMEKNRRGGNASPDLARLKGARLVTSIESDIDNRFAEGLIKQLTGGDTITARRLYSEEFEFESEFKIFFATNHRPEIRGMDHAIWRRIMSIDFNVRFSGENKDPGLGETLDLELSGILNWALQGYREWSTNGLNPPAQVLQATEQYRSEMDVLGEFIEDCTVSNSEGRISSSELYEGYVSWCIRMREKPVSQKKFSTLLKERDFRKTRDQNKRYWEGVELRENVIRFSTGMTDMTD